MKIIYEDSNGRNNNRPTENGSDGFSRSNLPPEVKSVRSSRKPRKETQHISSGIPEETAETAKTQGEPSAQTAPQTAGPMPEFKLTQEQIAILLRQYLNANPESAPAPSPAPEAKQPQPQSQALTPVSEKEDDSNSGRAGTRIVFQSPDFDSPDEGLPRYGGPVIPSEYDYDFDEDDEDFEENYEIPSPKALPRPGDISQADYTVDEIDISSQKPAEPQRPKAPVSAPIIRRRAQDGGSYIPQNIPVQPANVNSPVSTVTSNVPVSESLVVEDVEETDSKGKGGKKKPSVSEIIRLTVLSVSIIAIVISAAVLLKEYKLHKDNQKLESDVSNLIVSEEESTTKKPSKDDKKDQVTETTLSAEQKWAQIKAEYPNTIFPPNIQLKYAKLYATNNDFVGYLEAKGVNLSLPVVQTDNDSVYLEKNFYGQSTKYGCPFVTYLNNIEPLDLNTVIFGHHMNDKTIFGALDNYKEIDGFKKAPVITFNTLYKNYKWKVIAAFITNAEEKDDNGYIFRYYFTSLSTQERFSAYLNALAQRSLYDTGVDVLPTD
ncbi:MAG: class B sortase [Clostridia bacterium]|nr:class B sortase [Clostridia bacterium]